MKKTALIIVLLPSIVLAIPSKKSIRQEMITQQMAVLAKEGVVIPGSGVTLVSEEELNIPIWIREKMLSDLRQKEKLGYRKEEISRAIELLSYKKRADKQFKHQADSLESWNTRLRPKISDLKLAYPYHGVPMADITHFIGIAPVGKYTRKGWSGAIEYFDTSFASCAYTEKNLQITKGASRVNKDSVTYKVNGKITLLDIIGTDAGGYLYQTTWFDDHFERALECANMTYLPKITEELIELAKRIDNNQEEGDDLFGR